MNEDSLRAERRWWQPGPLDWSAREMVWMRLGFAALVYVAIKWETGAWTTQKFPNGMAQVVDLTWIGRAPPGWGWKALTLGGLAAYVLGRLPVLGLLPALGFSLVIGTLGNSQGAINHSTQMVSMMLLGQFLVYLFPGAGAGLRPWWGPGLALQRRAVYAATVVMAASYVVCGVVKLSNSNFRWLQDAPFLAVQLLKTNWSHYHDTLEMPPVWLQAVTQALVEHPNLARLCFGSGLLIELAAFVVLINRRWALVGGVAIVALHLSISQLMNLNFLNHILAAGIFLVNVPGWVLRKAAGPEAG